MKLAPFVEDLGPYWTGDTPSAPLTLEFLGDDASVVELPEGPIGAFLVDPDGVARPGFGVTSPADEPDADDQWAGLTWPAAFTLDLPGVWQLVAVVGGRRLPSAPFVVQTDDGWHTLDSARSEWIEARQASDVQLFTLLDSARVQCLAYAPRLSVTLDGAEVPLPVPTHYRTAQLMQARALWQSMRANADPSAEGEFAVPTFPMDWTVRGILRPRNPKARRSS